MTEPTGRDPDRLPDTSDPSGPCPRCGRPSNFGYAGSIELTFKDGVYAVGRASGPQRIASQRVSVLECSYCRQRTAVVEAEHNDRGTLSWRGLHWWPIPGSTDLGADVPNDVIAAYAEGVRALSARAPNGAVAMFRTAITYMVLDKGSDSAKARSDLKDKLAQMVADGGPMASLGDWATHVRLYGNAGAHPDLFGGVSVEEAQEVSRLVGTMIDLLYVLPANIAKRQAERRP